MPTYIGQATASSKTIARFNFRPPRIVTATGSATVTSTVSQEEADKLANELAQQIADSQVQNDANNIIESVNISTIGEIIFGLNSSFLKDYVVENNQNDFTLIRNFNIDGPLTLRITQGQTFNINPGVTFSTGRGALHLEEGSILNQLSGSTVNFGQPLTNTKSSKSTQTTQYLPSTISSGSGYNVNSGSTANVNDGATFKVYGLVNNYGTFNNNNKKDQQFWIYGGGALFNYSTFNNNGLMTVDKGATIGSNFTKNGGTVTLLSGSYTKHQDNENTYGIFYNNLEAILKLYNCNWYYNNSHP